MKEDAMNALLNHREDLFWPFRERFDKFFDNFFGSDSLNTIRSLSRSGYPKLDVLVTKDGKFRIEMATPGVKLDQLLVQIVPYHGTDISPDSKRNVLKVSGQMDYDFQYSEDTTFQLKELRRSRFERSLLLPDNIVGDPEAVLENGILRLTWSAVEEQKPQTKTIEVQEIKS